MLRDMLMVMGSIVIVVAVTMYMMWTPIWWLGWIVVCLGYYAATIILRAWRHFCVLEKELELKTEFEKMLRR